jgi:translation initiation factor 2 subunit 1
MPANIKKELVKNIRQRLNPQPIKIRADIECTCFGYEGIDAIKTALLAGEACSTATVPIKIKLVAPPLYVMITNSTDKPNAIATMEKAIVVIEESIKGNHGSLAVKMKV